MAQTPDAAAVAAAMETLSKEDFGTDNTPNMKPLNKALKAAGFAPITAAERDAFMADILTGGEDTNTEPAPEGTVRIHLHDAPSNPLPLYVHGVGGFSLRAGEEHVLPVEALDALRNTDAKFTEVEAS